jgi:hypothetical protein
MVAEARGHLQLAFGTLTYPHLILPYSAYYILNLVYMAN